MLIKRKRTPVMSRPLQNLMIIIASYDNYRVAPHP